jgi:hypothetical protein
MMYLQGWDELQLNEESLSEVIPEREEGSWAINVLYWQYF